MEIRREKIENSNGYDQVVNFLREQLLTGELKAGDSLLPERELSAKLGVSRPVLREALRALSMIGAVEIRHGIGTVVTKPDISVLGEFFTFVLAHQTNVVDDVMQARIAIERQAVRLACRRGTQSDYDRLATCLKEIIDTIHDPQSGYLADFRFHETIVNASGSPTLINIYQSISVLVHRSHLDRREQIMQVEGIEEFLIDHHRAIFSAIVERNEDLADELLGRHFEIGADFRRRATIRMVSTSPLSN